MLAPATSVKLFLIMRNNGVLKGNLTQLGLGNDESTIFLCLLDAPRSRLDVSRLTGIARSSVYRLVDGMIDRGLAHEVTTGDDKVLVAVRPEALEQLVATHEAAAQQARTSFEQVMPMLTTFLRPENDFSIRTYSGLGGIKQMLWNELKSESEVLVFSSGLLDDATGEKWAEKYRAEVIRRGLKERIIGNVEIARAVKKVVPYSDHYEVRLVPKAVLDIGCELSVYDGTIALYNSLDHGVRLGTEIVNPFLASFMRQVFDRYWSVAKSVQT
jgi:sugar-specific transcriptional regulator TrmB